MNVLLVVPHYSDRISRVAQTTIGPPLGLAYLAAVALRRGIAVSILDANALRLADAQVARRIVAAAPDVVGFTAVTPTVDQCARIARDVRAGLPRALLVLGGMHATAAPEKTLARHPAFDLAFRGEGDTRFADLLEGLAAGRTFADFPGLTYRRDGEVVSTSTVTSLEDLDTLPFPARHLLPMDRYVGPDGGRFTAIVGARGCPGSCIYCSVNQTFGGRLRYRDPESVAREMDEAAARYGTRTFGFVDDTFTSSRSWVERLCLAITARGLHRRARWTCLTRVDRVDPELLGTMRRAGCFRVEFGIESGDQSVLDSLGKGTRTEQILSAFAGARRAGLSTLAFVMLFSPAETRGSLAATRRLVFRADPDYLQASFCTPYPGTRLAEECERQGIRVADDWSRYVFLTEPVIDHPRFSASEMTEYQRRLLRAFYLRPRTIARLLRAHLDPRVWRGFLHAVAAALRALLNR